MGNGCSISVDLHKERGQKETTPVTAGSVLLGKVIVELTSPLYLEPRKSHNTSNSNNNKPIDLSLVTLRIYGKEKVGMKIHAAKKRARDLGHSLSSEYPYPSTAERQFFDVNLPLREFPESAYDTTKNRIKPGTYKFPFQVHLPPILPSTSSYNPYTRGQHSAKEWTLTGKKPGFRIQYKMYVELHSVLKKGRNGQNFRTPSQYLWVVSAPKTSIHTEAVPAMILPDPHTVNTFHGLWTQGTVLTAAFLEDSIVSRSDDHINLHIACRNNSTAAVQRVQLDLVETVRWGTVATSGQANDLVLQEEHKILLFSLRDIELPSIGKNRLTFTGSLVQSIFGTKSKERELLRSIHADLKSDDSKLSLTLPLQSMARDTYSGQLAQISHHVEIRFVTEGNIGSYPSITIPVRMVNGDRHSIEAADSFCNSVTESDTPDYVAATGCEHLSAETIENAVDVTHADFVELESNEKEPLHLSSIGEQASLNSPYDSLVPMAVAKIDSSRIIVGGNAAGIPYGDHMTPLSDLIPLAPPLEANPKSSTPSLVVLFSEMRSSVDAYNTVLDKMRTPSWTRFFEKLSPYEFGQVIARVTDPFDQPRVAVLLGEQVNQRMNETCSKDKSANGLTCEYVAFAIRSTSEMHRSTTAKGLIPLCVDVAANYKLIISELSDWEQTVILNELESAITETMPSVKKGFLNCSPKSVKGQDKIPVAC